MKKAEFIDIHVNDMTPRLNPDFLGFADRILASMMDTAAALGDSINTQS